MSICREGCTGVRVSPAKPPGQETETDQAGDAAPSSRKKAHKKPDNKAIEGAFQEDRGGLDILAISSDDDSLLNAANKLARGASKADPDMKRILRRAAKEAQSASTNQPKESKTPSSSQLGRLKKRSSNNPPSPQPSNDDDLHERQSSTGGKSDEDSDSAGSAVRPLSGGKTPRKTPKPMDTYVPPRLPGNRPTVDPRRPNHREMVFPLCVGEHVVFKDPETDEVRTGYVTTKVTNERQLVTVRSYNHELHEYEVVDSLSVQNMNVVKVTDHLIYPGVRYCVFGPPPTSFAGLMWGSAWLDLASERAHFISEGNAHDKLLYELRRLDVVMLSYPGVPDCPVLIIGFVQGMDDSDWKAIGLLNCHEDESIATEKAALENICYMPMVDLKKEYATSDSYIVEEVVELDEAAHPTVKMYKQALTYISKWSRGYPRWLPSKTWKSRLTSKYPRQFKTLVAKGLEPKACTICPALEKQVDLLKVRPRDVALLTHAL